MMYRTIVVPIDLGSPELGRKTLLTAREIGGPDCRIIALYVAEEIPSFIMSELPRDARQKNLAAAQTVLQALAGEVGAEAAVRAGYPPLKVSEFAEAIGAELIVVDSHRFEPEDYLFGTPAVRIVRHARCPVLVCPPADDAGRLAV